jgi:uncharacterized RDD family membrane protein YckC
LAASAARAEERRLVAGDDRGLWLVHLHPSDNTFDLAFRPAGGRWKWVSTELTGRPAVAVALEGGLHVIFQSGQYRIFPSGGGEGMPGEGLEQPPLAACGGKLGDSPYATIVAILPLAQPATATAPTPHATEAKDKPPAKARTATTRAEQPVSLEVWQNVQLRWERMTELAASPGDIAGGIKAGIVDGTLYVLIPGVPHRLLAWRNQAWQDVPLDSPTGLAAVPGVVGLDDRLVIVAAKEAEAGQASLTVGAYSPADKTFSWQPVRQDGKPAVWPQHHLPMVARLAERAALVWEAGEKLRFSALSPLTGQLDPAEDVEPLGRPQLDEVAQQAYKYFFLAVSFLILVSLFRTRRPVPYRPFSLPADLPPANLGRRLLAAVIDLLPCNLVAGIFVHLSLPPMTPEEFSNLFLRIHRGDQVPPFSIVAAGIMVMLIYVPYCVIMERRFGATLGKMVFKLRVVADEGRPPDLREAMLRNLAKVLELSWPPLLPLLILIPLLSRHRQRLGDMLARTAVADGRLAGLPPPSQPRQQEGPSGGQPPPPPPQ